MRRSYKPSETDTGLRRPEIWRNWHVNDSEQGTGELPTSKPGPNSSGMQTESEGHFSSRLKRLRLRSKVSFTQSTLENTIQRLREGNGDLERLSRQIENLKRGIRPSGSMRLASISRFSMVQRASRKLYELLSNQWGCPAEHLANISLGAGVPDTGKDGIRFYLRWECLQCTEPATSNKPVWLAAETFPNSAVTTPHTTPQGQSHGPSKSAQDLVEAIGGLLKRDNAMLTPTPFLAASRIDLKSTPNLCARFKSQSLEPTDGASLGFLQDADASEHMIFPCREPFECQASMSLRDALCQASKLLCGIPPVNRMHLAKVLSEAILQYHSTPWMDSEWRSTDVLFYGIQDLNKDSLDTPYLRACSMKAGSSPRATMVLSQHDYSVLAPNKLLYSLGIMLIELAFERPLKDMQESQEIIASDSPSVSFHRTALRLADVVGKKVNVKYETVVKRCLRCNFDQDSSQLELDELGWQKAYHRTVVCELERCFEAAAIC